MAQCRSDLVRGSCWVVRAGESDPASRRLLCMSPVLVTLLPASALSHEAWWNEVSPEKSPSHLSEPKPSNAASSAPPAQHQNIPKAAVGPGYLLSVGLFELLPCGSSSPGQSRVRQQVINSPHRALFFRYFKITATFVSWPLSLSAGSVCSTGDYSHLVLFMYITLGLSEEPRKAR